MRLYTYLNFRGNCEEAFRFYEKHLGGKITAIVPFGTPGAPTVPVNWKHKVMHARMDLGETQVMGSDRPFDRFSPSSSYLALMLDSNEEAERVYKLLAEDGAIFTKIGETFFAYRFAVLRDKFGVSWMLMHEKPQPA